MSHDPANETVPSGRPSLSELEPLVRAALAQYGLPGAEFENQRYYNNATYRVNAADGQVYALRVTANHFTEAELHSEMQWLRTMQADPGVRVPMPVATPDGRFVSRASAPTLAEPRLCCLFQWLEGAHLREESMSAADFAHVGVASAKLHRQSAEFVAPHGFERPRRDAQRWLDRQVESTYERILAHLRRYFPPDQVQRFAQLAERASTLMDSLRSDPAHYGLVHGDFHADNYLFHPAGVSFIDFEDLGWGYFLYDLATALFGVIERPDYQALVTAFVTGYTRIRSLPEPFAHYLLPFQALRAVFLTSLVVTRGDLAESTWWEGYVVGKLRHLFEEVGHLRAGLAEQAE